MLYIYKYFSKNTWNCKVELSTALRVFKITSVSELQRSEALMAYLVGVLNGSAKLNNRQRGH